MSDPKQELDSIDFNIGIMLNTDQVAKAQEACQKAYDIGDDAGYARGFIEAMQMIAVLCQREPTNTIEISDDEGYAIGKGKIHKNYISSEGKTVFRWEET